MKKKSKILLGLGCATVLTLGLAACKKETTPLEDLQDQGYRIMVTYNPSGGEMIGNVGTTVVDMFNPADYQADSQGNVRIKLLEPTDKRRPSSGTDAISVVKDDHFFAGWYANRTVKTKDGTPEEQGGVPVDDSGKELKRVEDIDGYVSYVYVDDEKTAATPAYAYSDYWDFENDRIEYNVADEELKTLTLYAGWVPYYEFTYYYQVDGVWTEYGTATEFNYKTTNAEGSKTHDKDTIWVPNWNNGAMSHAYSYENGDPYTFPKLDGFTFSEAFTDPDCQNKITESFTHQGSLDVENCTAINPVQKIYVKFIAGDWYRIETAKQLTDNANLKGNYEILADLDFSETDAAWPTTFAIGKFEGQMYSSAGQKYSIKNVTAKFASDSSVSGGMFGTVAATATIKDLVFENVTTDISYANGRLRDFKFGAFAGTIEENATVANVTFGGTLKIGAIKLDNGYTINLLATGNIAGITAGDLHLQIYGTKRVNDYKYTVKMDETEAVKVDENGNVTLMFVSVYASTQEIYNIQ